MKRILHAIGMSFGMFCAIPCPYRGWDEEARPLTTVFLPLVGLFTGALWYGLSLLLKMAGIPSMVFAALMTLFPYVITGCIHLDGFMDCCDAIFSRRELTEKQKILKDSRVGAFAVISLAGLFLLGFSFFASTGTEETLLPLLFAPAAARAVAGIMLSLIQPIQHSQYSGEYHRGVKKRHVLAMAGELAVVLVSCALICGPRTIFVPGIAAAAVLAAACYASRQLGGISGDVSGFSITVGELCAVAALLFL